MLDLSHATECAVATGVKPMQLKAIAFVIIVAVSIALFVALRHDNRADAAAGNCYSAAKGPSTPTVCN